MTPEQIAEADARQKQRETASGPVLHVALGDFTYPVDHTPAEEVPEGGSCCANCRYLVPMGPDGPACSEENFIAASLPNKPAGSARIPADTRKFCSDWWQVATIVSLDRLKASGAI